MIRLAGDVLDALRFHWKVRRIERRLKEATALRRRAFELEAEAVRLTNLLEPTVLGKRHRIGV